MTTTRMDGNYLYKSFPGSIISVLIFFVCLAVAINKITEKETEISVIQHRSQSGNPLPIYINATNFMFALYLNTPQFPTHTVFDITVEKRNDVRYLNGTKVRNVEYLKM